MIRRLSAGRAATAIGGAIGSSGASQQPVGSSFSTPNPLTGNTAPNSATGTLPMSDSTANVDSTGQIHPLETSTQFPASSVASPHLQFLQDVQAIAGEEDSSLLEDISDTAKPNEGLEEPSRVKGSEENEDTQGATISEKHLSPESGTSMWLPTGMMVNSESRRLFDIVPQVPQELKESDKQKQIIRSPKSIFYPTDQKPGSVQDTYEQATPSINTGTHSQSATAMLRRSVHSQFYPPAFPFGLMGAMAPIIAKRYASTGSFSHEGQKKFGIILKRKRQLIKQHIKNANKASTKSPLSKQQQAKMTFLQQASVQAVQTHSAKKGTKTGDINTFLHASGKQRQFHHKMNDTFFGMKLAKSQDASSREDKLKMTHVTLRGTKGQSAYVAMTDSQLQDGNPKHPLVNPDRTKKYLQALEGQRNPLFATSGLAKKQLQLGGHATIQDLIAPNKFGTQELPGVLGANKKKFASLVERNTYQAITALPDQDPMKKIIMGRIFNKNNVTQEDIDAVANYIESRMGELTGSEAELDAEEPAYNKKAKKKRKKIPPPILSIPNTTNSNQPSNSNVTPNKLGTQELSGARNDNVTQKVIDDATNSVDQTGYEADIEAEEPTHKKKVKKKAKKQPSPLQRMHNTKSTSTRNTK